jgi:signal transduction histidine kinase
VIQLRERNARVTAVTAELRRSLAEVRDRDVTTRAVLETVDAGISLYDPEGNVLLSNALASTARQATPHASTTQIGDEPDIFEGDRTTPMPLEDQIVARAARGELVTRRSFWVNAGAQQRAVVATSQYVRRDSGELIGTVVATHDVTQLAEALRARDEFLSTVSHELKTPLTSILGYLEIVEDHPDFADSGLAKEVEAIQRNSHRLHNLITALLATAKGHLSVDRRPYDIARLVENSVNAAQAAAEAASVTLVADAETGTIAEIDADHINSVIDALIANGLTFSTVGGTVTVSVTSDDTTALIRVTDTGIGMNSHDLERMFDRFYRARSSHNNVVPGSGLGLTAAKVVVDAHHGTITASSVEGEGTVVDVRLPLLSVDVGEQVYDVVV